MFPIYVLSKGRAGKATTCSLLDASRIPYYLFVPYEKEFDYKKKYQGTICYQTGNTLAKVRNELLSHARSYHTNQWVWMIDDDIRGFYSVGFTGKMQKETPHILEQAEKMIVALDIVQAAIQFKVTAWRSPCAITLNTNCPAVMALHTEKTLPVYYCEFLPKWEDCDFTLQLLCNGYYTANFSHWAFDTPPVGTVPGGLYKTYRTSAPKLAADWLCSHYGKDICAKRKNKQGIETLSVKWSYFSLKNIQKRSLSSQEASYE